MKAANPQRLLITVNCMMICGQRPHKLGSFTVMYNTINSTPGMLQDGCKCVKFKGRDSSDSITQSSISSGGDLSGVKLDFFDF